MLYIPCQCALSDYICRSLYTVILYILGHCILLDYIPQVTVCCTAKLYTQSHRTLPDYRYQVIVYCQAMYLRSLYTVQLTRSITVQCKHLSQHTLWLYTKGH